MGKVLLVSRFVQPHDFDRLFRVHAPSGQFNCVSCGSLGNRNHAKVILEGEGIVCDRTKCGVDYQQGRMQP